MHSGGLPRSTWLAAGTAVVVGLVGLWEGSGYDFGTARQIGPAVFPVALSILLLAAAAGIVIEALMGVSGPDPAPARPVVLAGVLGAPVAFSLVIGPFGLFPAIFAAVIVASLAERSLRPGAVLALAVTLGAACSLVFVVLLNLNIPVVRW